ncbi:MAG: serine/threonine-protein kinase [Planctomycetota bacterium]
MSPACPELEQLDAYVTDPSMSAAPVREHVAGCADCQARLAELSENQVLFAELSDSASLLGARLSVLKPPPRQMGAFDIVREVGRGGMGVVYEAQQKQPQRRVALKVLRGDYASSDERIRLFNREVRVLARLRHAGITSIFESGVSTEGPFYAMEFVEGLSLSDYAKQHDLSLRQRLDLYLKLCAAISYAHQHGVIHRDLKPGNVLVEEGGVPKVLDFGLARITDSDATGVSLAMDGGRIVGTLAYMSPEQTRGVTDEIDVRSDVYSLGVILFELLTGALPYDVSRTSVPMAVRSICESPTRRPSSAAAARQGDARSLQGDLDTIILKSLEKLPESRYQSVAAMAEDIERYLANQTIVARPPNAIYQFKKFAQRNRVLVGGIAGVIVALGLGIVATTWQAHRARLAERTALAEASISAEISRFLTTMFGSVNPVADGHDVRVVEILKRAATDIEKSFADQPRVAIALRDAIGRAYQSLTLYLEAEPQFQAGWELARNQYGDASRQALQFQYNLAEAMAHNGKTDPALKSLNSTLEAQKRQFGVDDADTLTTMHFLAVVKVEQGNLEAGELLLREALAGRTRSLGPQHERTLDSMANLGILLNRRGKNTEAAELLHRAHDTATRTFGPESTQAIVFASYVATLANTPEELAAIEPIYRDIVDRGSRVFGPEHSQTLAFLGSLAQLLELRCEFVEAEAVARDLYDRLKKSRGERDPQTINAMGPLARLNGMNKKWKEAEELMRRMLALCREVFGEANSRTSDVMYDLAQLLKSRKKLPEALQLSQETLTRYISSQGESAVDTALTRGLMAETLRQLGRLDEAQPAAERALADLRAASSTDDLLTAWAESNLGTCLRDQTHYPQAEPLMLHAHQRLMARLGECHPICIESNERICALYRMWHAADPTGGHKTQAAEFEANHANAKRRAD